VIKISDVKQITPGLSSYKVQILPTRPPSVKSPQPSKPDSHYE
jgi:hypothetical protein